MENRTYAMAPTSRRTSQPVRNTKGGAVVIILLVFLFVAATAGGGYFAYNKWIRKPPLKTKLATIPLKKELIQFSNDAISPALYHNMVMIDEMLVTMEKELDRLKRIGKQFPNQKAVVSPRISALDGARKRLSTVLSDAAGRIEKMYVAWLVDRREGIDQIRDQKSSLTQGLAEAIRNEAGLVGRIKNNPEAHS